MSAAAVIGCGDRKQNETPPPSAPVYTLTDTIAAPSPHALVRRDGIVVDTADVAFGIQSVGRDSVLFLPMEADSNAMLVLYHGGVRTPVDSIVPDFDRRWSAPAVIANALLYWGVHTTNGVDSIRAIRYEFPRHRLNPLPVAAKLNRNDPTFRFTPPFLDGKEIVFKAPDGEWRFRTPKQ